MNKRLRTKKRLGELKALGSAREKNDTCNVSASCTVNDHVQLIAKDAKARLDHGQVNEADEPSRGVA